MLLNAVTLPRQINGIWWEISPVTGHLIRYSSVPRSIDSYTGGLKIKEALRFVDKPYECKPLLLDSAPMNHYSMDILSRYYSRLCKIGNHRFLASLVYASYRDCMFANSVDAAVEVAKISEQRPDKEDDLCLQRALLIAKTSKRFQSHGVLFVGANVQSGDMHAWVIEDGQQPDSQDRNWINYTPLLAITR